MRRGIFAMSREGRGWLTGGAKTAAEILCPPGNIYVFG